MLNEIALSTHLFVHETLTAEHLRSVRENGFTGVELWAAPPHLNYRSPGAWAEVADAVRNAGLTICSVHAPFYRAVPDAALGRFLSISAAEEAERRAAIDETSVLLAQMPLPTTDLLVVHPGKPADFLQPTGMDHLRPALEELLVLAGERGVRIALENMPFPGAGCEEVLAIADRLGSPHLGLGFDLGHANVLGTSSDFLRECLARAWVVHAHDNDGESDSHLLPFDGTTDWQAVAAGLRLSRPQAPFVLELKCDGHQYAACMREARLRTAKLFQDVE
jgi:sugar phosphate isomerase/epimerase